MRLQKKTVANPMYAEYLGKMSSGLETSILNKSAIKRKRNWVKTSSNAAGSKVLEFRIEVLLLNFGNQGVIIVMPEETHHCNMELSITG